MSSNKQQGFEELLRERPASIEQLVEKVNPDVYDSLKLAIELGKWSDGVRLKPEQIDFCMQTIILYEAKHLPETERVGFDLSASCASAIDSEQAQPVSVGESAGSINGIGFNSQSEEGKKA